MGTIVKEGIAGDVAREKLQAYVNRGRAVAVDVLTKLDAEAQARRDRIVPRSKMIFKVSPDDVRLGIESPEFPEPLAFTDWSFGQAIGTLGMRRDFVEGLQHDGETGVQIASGLMNSLRYRIGGENGEVPARKRLLRVVDHQVKGWLSPTYGIKDQGQLIYGFKEAIRQESAKGIIFTEGVLTDRRYGLSAIWPNTVEVWPGEWVVIGAQLQSSDYGFGAVDLKQQVIRLICLNGAIGTTFMRQIHRGSGMSDGDSEVFSLSEQTKALAAQTTISMLTDGVRAAFSDEAVEKTLDGYRNAAQRTVDVDGETAKLQKAGTLTKNGVATAKALIGDDMIEILPQTTAQNSALRFSNVLSYLAKAAEGESKLGLMTAAGTYLN